MRIPAARGLSIVKPRSKCPKCDNPIAWYDNIPIVSWLVLGAKCRHCSQPISWQYPLVEAVTGVLFLLVFWRFGIAIATPIYMLLSAALVLATFVDFTDEREGHVVGRGGLDGGLPGIGDDRQRAPAIVGAPAPFNQASFGHAGELV